MGACAYLAGTALLTMAGSEDRNNNLEKSRINQLISSLRLFRFERGKVIEGKGEGQKMRDNIGPGERYMCVWASPSKPWIIAAVGLGIVQCALLIVMTSYSLFYEPSVVNALEGGMQQLCNLLIAIVAYQICSFGRPVEDIPIKLLSFVLIVIGILLSTI